MSRLDSMIRRLQAQRACVDWAAAEIAGLPGPVLELGLGNGRTYDHLRERLPARDIFVFERQVNAHPDCVPDDDHLFLGDLLQTLPVAAAQLGRTVALAHSDVGTGDEARNAALAASIAPIVRAMMRPGGLLLCDQEFATPGLQALPLPDGVPPGRYHIYRAGD